MLPKVINQEKLSKRKEKILECIIRAYLENNEPVGSQFLKKKFSLSFSPATIRNEMAKLDQMGYLYQPHHSAGRIPTIEAYKYYLNNLFQEKKINNFDNYIQNWKKILKANADYYQNLKNLAKQVSEFLNECIFLALDKYHYYTGLALLFSKPEFAAQDFVCDLSKILDQLDEIVASLNLAPSEDIKVWLGEDNPFSPRCATLAFAFETPFSQKNIFGMLGPLRIDYPKAITTFREIKKIIAEIYDAK